MGVALAGPNNPPVLQVDAVLAGEVPQSDLHCIQHRGEELADFLHQDEPHHLGDLGDSNTKQYKCCCCVAHHKFSLHYTGMKFAALPCDNREWDLSNMVPMQDRDMAEQVQVDETLKGLMMSVNVDIGNIMGKD